MLKLSLLAFWRASLRKAARFRHIIKLLEPALADRPCKAKQRCSRGVQPRSLLQPCTQTLNPLLLLWGGGQYKRVRKISAFAIEFTSFSPQLEIKAKVRPNEMFPFSAIYDAKKWCLNCYLFTPTSCWNDCNSLLLPCSVAHVITSSKFQGNPYPSWWGAGDHPCLAASSQRAACYRTSRAVGFRVVCAMFPARWGRGGETGEINHQLFINIGLDIGPKSQLRGKAPLKINNQT